MGFDSWYEEIFLYSTASRAALVPTQCPHQRVPEPISSGVERPGREANDSPLSSAEVKHDRAISPLPPTSSWRGA
jgi:hypothetical protein